LLLSVNLDLDIKRKPSISLEEYARKFFSVLGAKPEKPSKGILRVELTRQQLCEVENRPWNSWYVSSALPELSTFYFTFDEAITKIDLQTELLAAHSHRLHQLIDTAMRIGRVSRLRVIPSQEKEGLVYKPMMVLGYRINLISTMCWSLFLPVAVDMITGKAGVNMAKQLFRFKMDEGPIPKPQRLLRELTFKQAIEIASECIKEALTKDDAIREWHREAEKRYRLELDKAEQFFLTFRAEGKKETENQHQKELKAIKDRFQPRVQASASLGLLLYCPVYT
jgi:hypothetical protein